MIQLLIIFITASLNSDQFLSSNKFIYSMSSVYTKNFQVSLLPNDIILFDNVSDVVCFLFYQIPLGFTVYENKTSSIFDFNQATNLNQYIHTTYKTRDMKRVKNKTSHINSNEKDGMLFYQFYSFVNKTQVIFKNSGKNSIENVKFAIMKTTVECLGDIFVSKKQEVRKDNPITFTWRNEDDDFLVFPQMKKCVIVENDNFFIFNSELQSNSNYYSYNKSQIQLKTERITKFIDFEIQYFNYGDLSKLTAFYGSHKRILKSYLSGQTEEPLLIIFETPNNCASSFLHLNYNVVEGNIENENSSMKTTKCNMKQPKSNDESNDESDDFIFIKNNEFSKQYCYGKNNNSSNDNDRNMPVIIGLALSFFFFAVFLVILHIRYKTRRNYQEGNQNNTTNNHDNNTTNINNTMNRNNHEVAENELPFANKIPEFYSDSTEIDKDDLKVKETPNKEISQIDVEKIDPYQINQVNKEAKQEDKSFSDFSSTSSSQRKGSEMRTPYTHTNDVIF